MKDALRIASCDQVPAGKLIGDDEACEAEDPPECEYSGRAMQRIFGSCYCQEHGDPERKSFDSSRLLPHVLGSRCEKLTAP